MRYNQLSNEEYARRTSEMIRDFEGYRASPYDARDNRATIGFGYTFNRDNNVALWGHAGVELSEIERRQLEAIDRAPENQKTALGLAFRVQITRDEARSLLENASLREYEGPAINLNMPESTERAVLTSITYNRGPGAVNRYMHGFANAVRDLDRAEAWYQLRYNSLGTAVVGTDNEFGVRARRYVESQIFGLYDDPLNVTPDEARSIYRMFQLHREDMLENESNWAVDLDGNRARRDALAQANNNYPNLVRQYGQPQTLAASLEPARTRLLDDLRVEHPGLADRLRNENFATTAIYLDPGRALRAGNNLRQDQPNNTIQDVDPNYTATLDSRRTRNNAEIDSNDLLIGLGGNDTLRSHRGDDLLLGGEGHDRMEGGLGRDTYVIGAGDTVLDSDGLGEIHWGGQPLTGGTHSQSDPASTYRSADGRFAYALQGGNLMVTDTQATDPTLRERAVIENFQSGQLDITLNTPEVATTSPEPDLFDRVFEALINKDDDALRALGNEYFQSPEGQQVLQEGSELGHAMERQADAMALAQGRPLPTGYSIGTLTGKQDPRDWDHPDHALYSAIRRELPREISDDMAAHVMLQARQAGIHTADRLEHVSVHNGQAFVGSRNFAGMAHVDLSQTPPPMKDTVQQSQQLDQQLALERQQWLALQQEQARTGPSMSL